MRRALGEWTIRDSRMVRVLRIIVLALVPSVQRHARLERRCPRPIAEALYNAHMAKPGWL